MALSLVVGISNSDAGDELFGVDITTKKHLYHWNLSDLNNNFVFNRISMNILSDDPNLGFMIQFFWKFIMDIYIYFKDLRMKGVEASKYHILIINQRTN